MLQKMGRLSDVEVSDFVHLDDRRVETIFHLLVFYFGRFILNLYISISISIFVLSLFLKINKCYVSRVEL